MNHVRQLLSAGFEILHLWDGKIVFRYDTPEEVLEHLLKSGAGTAFYDAIDPKKREQLKREFIETIARGKPPAGHEVIHDYICCIASLKRALKKMLEKIRKIIARNQKSNAAVRCKR